MPSLKNKTVLITGASSGIGLATAELFASHGARLLICGRTERPLKTLCENINKEGGTASYSLGDLSDECYVQQMSALAQKLYGTLNIVISNAGILGTLQAITDMSLQDWNDTLNNNLTSAFLTSKHLLPLLQKKGGSLLLTGSFVGTSCSFPGMSAYAASKAALTGLTQTLAVEYAEQGIRVNALLPGGTDTRMVDLFANTPETRQALESLYPLKRLASPKEIAQAALFLSSDASSFITGTTLMVDGGISISRM